MAAFAASLRSVERITFGGWNDRRPKAGEVLTCRCVRGGPPAPSSTGAEHYRREGDSIRDLGTRLLWQSTPASTAMTFREAIDYCAAAGTGWRLPSVIELQTLIDETRSAPAVDVGASPMWVPTRTGAQPLRRP